MRSLPTGLPSIASTKVRYDGARTCTEPVRSGSRSPSTGQTIPSAADFAGGAAGTEATVAVVAVAVAVGVAVAVAVVVAVAEIVVAVAVAVGVAVAVAEAVTVEVAGAATATTAT